MAQYKFEVSAIDGDWEFECDTVGEFTEQFGICEYTGYSGVTWDGINVVRPADIWTESVFEAFCNGGSL